MKEAYRHDFPRRIIYKSVVANVIFIGGNFPIVARNLLNKIRPQIIESRWLHSLLMLIAVKTPKHIIRTSNHPVRDKLLNKGRPRFTRIWIFEASNERVIENLRALLFITCASFIHI